MLTEVYPEGYYLSALGPQELHELEVWRCGDVGSVHSGHPPFFKGGGMALLQKC